MIREVDGRYPVNNGISGLVDIGDALEHDREFCHVTEGLVVVPLWWFSRSVGIFGNLSSPCSYSYIPVTAILAAQLPLAEDHNGDMVKRT
ncbi:hypothetical protein RRF57_008079 [Xylaria bambusicola]|uniref:Uncharacterized protein n=1 Tax=Xylaria bambusicola TaxID=326684 RepID=A0AAN7UH49_9PEZI